MKNEVWNPVHIDSEPMLRWKLGQVTAIHAVAHYGFWRIFEAYNDSAYGYKILLDRKDGSGLATWRETMDDAKKYAQDYHRKECLDLFDQYFR